MGKVVLQLVPVMAGAALAPFCLIIVLLLLRSQEGLSKAVAFVVGQVVMRLLQGLGIGAEFALAKVAQAKEGAAALVSTLVLVAGILLWVAALRGWAKQEDTDAPPPRWMGMVSSFSGPKAFALGLLATLGAGKQWLFTLYALGLIRVKALPGAHSALAYLVYILGAQTLVLVPLGLKALAPKRSAQVLEAATVWLERNNPAIVSVVSAVLGTFFLFKGITGLLE